MKNITGIDEAGRGAVLGPLVIAGVTVRKEDEEKLRDMGCKDSKVLKPKKREELAEKIEKVAANIIVLRVQPCTIDDYRASGQNLDMIEAMKMAQIITMNDDPGTVYVDALSSNPKGFEKKIVGYMKGKKADMVVKNYMDESVVVVSAASIVAKVERDKAIEDLKKASGVDFGVGYPHDKRTTDFIESFVKEKKELPSFVRRSWMTTQNIIEKNWQKKVGEFFSQKKKRGCD